MNMNQKGFSNIVLIVLIVIVLAGVVGYMALVKKSAPTEQSNNVQNVQPTPPTTTNNLPPPPVAKETSGLKTYSDNSLGFTFQYPNDYTVTEKEAAKTFYSSKGCEFWIKAVRGVSNYTLFQADGIAYKYNSANNAFELANKSPGYPASYYNPQYLKKNTSGAFYLKTNVGDAVVITTQHIFVSEEKDIVVSLNYATGQNVSEHGIDLSKNKVAGEMQKIVDSFSFNP